MMHDDPNPMIPAVICAVVLGLFTKDAIASTSLPGWTFYIALPLIAAVSMMVSFAAMRWAHRKWLADSEGDA